MRVKQGGRWLTGSNMVKAGGIWRKVTRTLIKVDGRWADAVGSLVAKLWTTRITVGISASTHTYGYGTAWPGFGGSTSTVTLAGNTVESFIAGDSEYLGVGPYQWIEMCVIGKVYDYTLHPLYLNGMVGRCVQIYRKGNRTYYQWVFPQRIAVNTDWVVLI